MKTFNLGKNTLKKNVLGAFGLRGMSMVSTYLMVPLLISYLDNYRYGLWMTIFSMLNWFQFFDIGLGNGLRNKFAESVASGNKRLAKMYVSTAYFLILIIAIVLFIAFGFSFYFINWYSVFNVSQSLVSELNLLILIVFGIQIASFPLKLISSMLLGSQRSAMANAFGPIGNILSLLIVYFFQSHFNGNNLLNVCIIYTVIPPLIYFIVTIYFFRTEFRDVSPSIKFVKKIYIKDMTGLGVKFFVLQINSLILMSATPLIIAQIMGQEYVTKYNVMFRLYNIPYLLYYILLTPFWSAFTSAYTSGDMTWIKNKMAFLLKIFCSLSLLLIVIFIFNKALFHLWVGSKVIPDQITGLYLVIYTLLMMLLLPFNYLINGTGKIKLQLYVSCFVTVFNIPLSIWLARDLKMGLNGPILANILCIFPFSLIMTLQTYMIVYAKKKGGIWNAA